jgi:hypothetical protein
VAEVVVPAQPLRRELGLVVDVDHLAGDVDQVLVGVDDAHARLSGERCQQLLDSRVRQLVVVVEEGHDVAGGHRQRVVRRRHDAAVRRSTVDAHPPVLAGERVEPSWHVRSG